MTSDGKRSGRKPGRFSEQLRMCSFFEKRKEKVERERARNPNVSGTEQL